jgi:hypothetical protein
MLFSEKISSIELKGATFSYPRYPWRNRPYNLETLKHWEHLDESLSRRFVNHFPVTKFTIDWSNQSQIETDLSMWRPCLTTSWPAIHKVLPWIEKCPGYIIWAFDRGKLFVKPVKSRKMPSWAQSNLIFDILHRLLKIWPSHGQTKKMTKIGQMTWERQMNLIEDASSCTYVGSPFSVQSSLSFIILLAQVESRLKCAGMKDSTWNRFLIIFLDAQQSGISPCKPSITTRRINIDYKQIVWIRNLIRVFVHFVESTIMNRPNLG